MELVTRFLTIMVDENELGWMSGTLCHVCITPVPSGQLLTVVCVVCMGDHRSSALERSDWVQRATCIQVLQRAVPGFCPTQTPITMPPTTHGMSGQTALFSAFALNAFGYSSIGDSHSPGIFLSF